MGRDIWAGTFGQGHLGRDIRAGTFGQGHSGRDIRAGTFGQGHSGRDFRAGTFGQGLSGRDFWDGIGYMFLTLFYYFVLQFSMYICRLGGACGMMSKKLSSLVFIPFPHPDNLWEPPRL